MTLYIISTHTGFLLNCLRGYRGGHACTPSRHLPPPPKKKTLSSAPTQASYSTVLGACMPPGCIYRLSYDSSDFITRATAAYCFASDVLPPLLRLPHRAAATSRPSHRHISSSPPSSYHHHHRHDRCLSNRPVWCTTDFNTAIHHHRQRHQTAIMPPSSSIAKRVRPGGSTLGPWSSLGTSCAARTTTPHTE